MPGADLDLSLVPYFYGDVSREDAELMLWDRGALNGMFLLRCGSADKDSAYVLSLCHNKEVFHYRIKRSDDGKYHIETQAAQKSTNLIDLIQRANGLRCRPLIPCNKALEVFLPGTQHWGVSAEDIERAIRAKASEWGLTDTDPSELVSNVDLCKLVLKSMHESQSWFHGKISREEAEARITASGLKDGKFLVRERDDRSFTLCLSYSGLIKHYKVDVLPTEQVGIQDGQRFDSLVALISHYSVLTDGLWCCLEEVCAKPGTVPIAMASNRPGEELKGSPAIMPFSQAQRNSILLHKAKHAPKKASNDASPETPKATPLITNKPNPTKASNETSQETPKATVPPLITNKSNPPKASNEISLETPKAALPITNKQNPTVVSKIYPPLPAETVKPSAPPLSHNKLRPAPPPPPVKPVKKTSVTSPPESSKLSANENTAHKADTCDKTDENPIAPKLAGLNNQLKVQQQLASVLQAGIVQKRQSVELENGTEAATIKLKPVPAPRKVSKPLPEEVPETTPSPEVQNAELSPTPSLNDGLSQSMENLSLHDPIPVPERESRCSLQYDPPWREIPIVTPPTNGRLYPDLTVLGDTAKRIVENSNNKQNGSKKNTEKSINPSKKKSKGFGWSSIENLFKKEPKAPKSQAKRLEVSAPTLLSEPLEPALRIGPILLENPIESSPEDSPEAQNESNLALRKKAPAPPPALTNMIAELKRSLNGPDDDSQKPDEDQSSVLSEPSYEEIDPDVKGDERNNSKNSAYNALYEHSPCLINSEPGVLSADVQESKWDDTREDSTSSETNNNTEKPDTKFRPSHQRKPTWTREESENHYKTLRAQRKTPTTIDRSGIQLQEKLGSGNFGDVMKAVLKLANIEVPFAVKMLKKSTTTESAKMEMKREAQIMTNLDHPHIVRLIGICDGDPFLLVMELAPLGPLNSYLLRNKQTPMADVLLVMYQVALGMEYLESCQFVHRDLAARNVLLVNETFAKISDFGMSRTLGLDSDYYRVEPQGKLPLKWYAPECIYYFRFSSKSDVWSYGITLWEAISFGEKPYQGMVGREILAMFAEGKRLSKPEKCPESAYDVMWQCWKERPEDRPSFSEVVRLMQNCRLNSSN